VAEALARALDQGILAGPGRPHDENEHASAKRGQGYSFRISLSRLNS
jgi:hypothetical protein